MKVCEKCSVGIDGKDGENLCPDCEAGKKKRENAAKRRRERDDVMRSLGLKKVRAMGGTYYE
jgi:uncharacterized Zn finger protein (UPF0148 family)